MRLDFPLTPPDNVVEDSIILLNEEVPRGNREFQCAGGREEEIRQGFVVTRSTGPLVARYPRISGISIHISPSTLPG